MGDKWALTLHIHTYNQVTKDLNYFPPLLSPAHLSYLPSKEFRQVMALPSSHHTNPPSQWSADEEEMKYGPFSDGEADTMKKGTLDFF